MIIEHKDFKISYFSTEQKEKIEDNLTKLAKHNKDLVAASTAQKKLWGP